MNRNLILLALLLILGCKEKENIAPESYVLHKFMQTSFEGNEFMSEADYENGRISTLTSYFNNEISQRLIYTYSNNLYRVYRTDETFNTRLDKYHQEFQFDNSGRLIKKIENDYSYNTGEYTENFIISTYTYKSDTIYQKREKFWNEADPKWTAIQDLKWVKDSDNNTVYEWSKQRSQNEVHTYEMTHGDHLNPFYKQTGYELPEISRFTLTNFKFYIDEVKRNEKNYLHIPNEQGLISTSISGYDTIFYEYKIIRR